MAKIQRKAQKIFAGAANTDEKAVFGSMKTGTPVYSDDVEQLQSSDYEQGWQNSIVLEKAPFLEEMNGVQYGLSSQIAYLLQQGIPEWDAETTYYTNGFCSYNGVIYKSLIDDNLGNIPSETQLSWEEFTSGGEGDSLYDKITNCILSNAGASITPTDYIQQAYVNKDCTISETNVVSGFSATSYIILNKTFTNSSSFTFTIPFTLTATTGVQPIVAINDTANSLAVVNGVLRLNYMGETLTGTTTLAPSTAYTVQFIRTDNGYTVQIKSAANEDYTQEINLPSSLDYFSGKTVYLGSDRVNALNGTIDLANTSITADNAIFWDINTLLDFQTVTLSGSLDTLMPNGRKEDLTLNNLEQTVTLDTTLLLNNATGNTKTILVKDNNEVMIRDSYTESSDEPADAVSGAIWLDTDVNQMKEQQVVLPNLLNAGCSFYDGVASNFSQASYLSLPSEYDLGTDWSISLPINIQKNADNDMNVILGDLTKEGSSVIPDSVALVYDGDETVTAYLRREDVYGVTKQVVTSTAYKVTKGETTGYVSVEGSTGTYVPASTQVYADSGLSVELETAAANTWTYTGDSVENTATQSGYVRESGSVFVVNGVQVYTTADLTTPLETASGSDWVYTGATSPSMIGALNETVAPQDDNVTITGSLSNNNGILSGFSASNYATLPITLNFGSEPWEMVWKITAPSSYINEDTLIVFGAVNNIMGIAYNIKADTLETFLSSNGTSWDLLNSENKAAFDFQGNKNYYIRTSYNGTEYKQEVSETGGESDWQTVATYEISTPIFSNYTPGLGIWIVNDDSNFFRGGSIDIKESYIKRGDNIIWQYQSGDNTLELSYNGTQYSLGSQTLASTDAVKSGWQPTIGSAPSTADAYFNSTIDIGNAEMSFWTWNGISDIKPNINLIGGVGFNNGVLSGFSTSNYATLPQIFNPGSNPWEMVWKITTGGNLVNQTIVGRIEGQQLAIDIGNSKFRISVSSNGTSWDVVNNQTGTYTVLTNTTYWVKVSFTGTSYTLAYSLTGEPQSYITDITVSSSTPVFIPDSPNIYLGRDNSGENIMSGTIDLNESYININGQTWWKWNGVTEAGYSWQTFPAAKIGEVTMKSETRVIEPNLTITGTLTNNNGVFSGFSTTNYGTFNGSSVIAAPESFEILFKITTGSSFPSYARIINPIISSGDSTLAPYIQVASSGIILVWYDGSSYSSYTAIETPHLNTMYWLKWAYDGSTITGLYSLDGKAYTTVSNNGNPVTPRFNTTTLRLGSRNNDSQAVFNGSIDLNESYIKINDEIWWKWSGVMETTTVTSNFFDSASLSYPVELVKKEDYVSLLDMVYPIGFPMPSIDGTLRTGEIWLEGATVNISSYPALYSVYGTTYGGDGEVNFQLPDLRNRVLWGSGDNTFGPLEAGLPNLTGSVYTQNVAVGGGGAQWRGGETGVLYPSGGSAAGAAGNNWVTVNNTINFNAQRGNAIYGASSTVQPPSIKVRWKTRYK